MKMAKVDEKVKKQEEVLEKLVKFIKLHSSKQNICNTIYGKVKFKVYFERLDCGYADQVVDEDSISIQGIKKDLNDLMRDILNGYIVDEIYESKEFRSIANEYEDIFGEVEDMFNFEEDGYFEKMLKRTERKLKLKLK